MIYINLFICSVKHRCVDSLVEIGCSAIKAVHAECRVQVRRDWHDSKAYKSHLWVQQVIQQIMIKLEL